MREIAEKTSGGTARRKRTKDERKADKLEKKRIKQLIKQSRARSRSGVTKTRKSRVKSRTKSRCRRKSGVSHSTSRRPTPSRRAIRRMRMKKKRKEERKKRRKERRKRLRRKIKKMRKRARRRARRKAKLAGTAIGMEPKSAGTPSTKPNTGRRKKAKKPTTGVKESQEPTMGPEPTSRTPTEKSKDSKSVNKKYLNMTKSERKKAMRKKKRKMRRRLLRKKKLIAAGKSKSPTTLSNMKKKRNKRDAITGLTIKETVIKEKNKKLRKRRRRRRKKVKAQRRRLNRQLLARKHRKAKLRAKIRLLLVADVKKLIAKVKKRRKRILLKFRKRRLRVCKEKRKAQRALRRALRQARHRRKKYQKYRRMLRRKAKKNNVKLQKTTKKNVVKKRKAWKRPERNRMRVPYRKRYPVKQAVVYPPELENKEIFIKARAATVFNFGTFRFREHIKGNSGNVMGEIIAVPDEVVFGETQEKEKQEYLKKNNNYCYEVKFQPKRFELRYKAQLTHEKHGSREAQIICQLNKIHSENVGRLFGYGQYNECNLQYTMVSHSDLILTDAIKQAKRKWAAPVYVHIIQQTFQCIRDLHKIGYAHLQVKPSVFSINTLNGQCVVFNSFALAEPLEELFKDSEIPGNYDLKYLNRGIRRRQLPENVINPYMSRRQHFRMRKGVADDYESWFYVCVRIANWELLKWAKMTDHFEMAMAKYDFAKTYSHPDKVTDKNMKTLYKYALSASEEKSEKVAYYLKRFIQKWKDSFGEFKNFPWETSKPVKTPAQLRKAREELAEKRRIEAEEQTKQMEKEKEKGEKKGNDKEKGKGKEKEQQTQKQK